MEPIRAREHLDQFNILGHLLSGPEGADARRELQAALAQVAFADEPDQLAAALEAITRK